MMTELVSWLRDELVTIVTPHLTEPQLVHGNFPYQRCNCSIGQYC
jgi:Flp pilus assembly secretin CpaC